MSRKSKFASGLDAIDDKVLELPPEEELTRPISGSPLLLIDLPQETVPLLDLYLEIMIEDSLEGGDCLLKEELKFLKT